MTDHDFAPDDTCPNCGGEGVVHLCLDEIGCAEPEEGCDLCERRCDWCQPARVAASATRKCRVCGCTDTSACMTEDGPCFWLEEDLCSGCLDKEDGNV